MRKLLFFSAGIIALAVALFVRAHGSADARERLTGIVLMAPSASTVTVHHAAFAGMPSMTMDFRVPAGTVVHPGERIAADVDRSTEPWSLSAIRVITAAPSTSNFIAPNFLNPGDRVPDLAVIDQRGRHETLDALHGRPYALTFIYTRCRDPKMCPFVSAKIHQVQSQTAGTPIQLVEVSLDPAYDRPPVLARYGNIYGADPARWHLFTGDPRSVLDFAARFRILEHSAGPTTIVHSERLAIVNTNGRITQFIDNPNWQPATVAAALTHT
jgi:cytochrome oxidase Cu insertion factor (SCO1/SenC/PrrC family)/Cu/Ag efflux protein CusF